MDGERGHGRVKGLAVEWEGFGGGLDGRGKVSRALGAHGRGWLDGKDDERERKIGGGRLVGARAGSDIEQGERAIGGWIVPLGDRRVDACRDARVCSAVLRVPNTCYGVIHVSGSACCLWHGELLAD